MKGFSKRRVSNSPVLWDGMDHMTLCEPGLDAIAGCVIVPAARVDAAIT